MKLYTFNPDFQKIAYILSKETGIPNEFFNIELSFDRIGYARTRTGLVFNFRLTKTGNVKKGSVRRD